MEKTIRETLETSAQLRLKMSQDAALIQATQKATEQLLKTIRAGGTIYTCGNGGSACDAMHFVEELVTRYKRERPGIRAMHFMDPGNLTCWSNDYSYEGVFERQASTFCQANDTLVCFSTSGRSANCIAATKAAQARGAFVLGLLGKDGGALAPLCNLSLIVPAAETERIQEVHITWVHLFCELIEQDLERTPR